MSSMYLFVLKVSDKQDLINGLNILDEVEGGSPLINGTPRIHYKLVPELANYLSLESVNEYFIFDTFIKSSSIANDEIITKIFNEIIKYGEVLVTTDDRFDYFMTDDEFSKLKLTKLTKINSLREFMLQ